jgi:lipoprotein-anchoring transpeptidase ErfK/SrfK
MTDDELERTLREAFAARARSEVDDTRPPPPPRFASGPSRAHGGRHRSRLLAPLAAAAAVIAVVGGIVAVAQRSGSRPDHRVVAGAPTASTTASATGATPVHIEMRTADDRSYGVGMPVVALFSKQFTSARALSAATKVEVNGVRAHAAWYFARSSYKQGYPIEGHLRMKSYWPAHAKIQVTLATEGVSAGEGLVFDDSDTLTFGTGARTVAVVDDFQHQLTVKRDGKPIGVYPVSLGAPQTPTMRGLKVIMEKGDSICMSGPGYRQCGVKYTQRLTYGGEYLHSAPWNMPNIKRGVDSSNGCTNLDPTAAQTLYKVLEVGDVVSYPNAAGPMVDLSSGYGDWNVPWSTWLTGGLVPTS